MSAGREPVHVKARRYLVEGRLIVSHVGESEIRATCRGGGDEYQLAFAAGRGWSCSCPARSLCAHLVALQLVTAVRLGQGDA